MGCIESFVKDTFWVASCFLKQTLMVLWFQFAWKSWPWPKNLLGFFSVLTCRRVLEDSRCPPWTRAWRRCCRWGWRSTPRRPPPCRPPLWPGTPPARSEHFAMKLHDEKWASWKSFFSQFLQKYSPLPPATPLSQTFPWLTEIYFS